MALLAMALACSKGPPPEYTRVTGPAPAAVDGRGAVLVVFWATWCPPCVEELPGLRALARDPPAPMRVLTFAEEERAESLNEHFEGAPPPELGLLLDRERAAAQAFGVDELPTAFLVLDGHLLARFSGPRDWNGRGMRALLRKLLAEPQVAPWRAPGRSR